MWMILRDLYLGELLRRGVGEKENFIAPSEVFLEQLRDYFAPADHHP